MNRSLAAALALTTTLSLAVTASAQVDPRYLGAMRTELTAMGLTAQCAATAAETGACRVQAASSGAAGARRYLLALEYSDVTDTVYVYIDHYATIAGDAPGAGAVFRRLAEMNWEMLVGKFEWSTSNGELRLGAVLQTDSNFDRRAFRGVVRSVLRLADRYADEVARMTGSPVGETGGAAIAPIPAQPTAPAH